MDIVPLDYEPKISKVQFLSGPICLNWIAKASSLSGKSLSLAIVLVHIARVSGSVSRVTLRPSLLRRFGIKRNASYRAIKLLSAANLIEVIERKKGKAAVVSLKNAIPKGMSWKGTSKNEKQSVE